jgi:hypothetical protein
MRFLIPALILVVLVGFQLAQSSSAASYWGARMTVLRITSNALVGLTCFTIGILVLLYVLSKGAA